jgi:phosphoenolpyruvate carboxykinase (ATP)
LDNADRTGRGDHPKHIMLLIRDGYGIFPSIAKLTPEQACYHFLCGYSTHIYYAQTGAVNRVDPLFNSCFGSFSNVFHPTVYANLLYERICDHDLKCWLVNTGWLGDYKHQGHPLSVAMTRLILNGIYTETIDEAEYETLPIFKLRYPTAIEGTSPKHTNVRMAWGNDEEGFHERIHMIAKMFIEKFSPYEHQIASQVKQAGPHF